MGSKVDHEMTFQWFKTAMKLPSSLHTYLAEQSLYKPGSLNIPMGEGFTGLILLRQITAVQGCWEQRKSVFSTTQPLGSHPYSNQCLYSHAHAVGPGSVNWKRREQRTGGPAGPECGKCFYLIMKEFWLPAQAMDKINPVNILYGFGRASKDPTHI